MIICAFSGCGKSTLVNKYKNVFDLDSFGWSQKPDFPENYLHELDLLISSPAYQDYDFLISTHPEVLQGLLERKYPFMLVGPDSNVTYEQWANRWNREIDGDEFKEKMRENFDKFVKDINTFGVTHDAQCLFARLHADEYLSDIYLSMKQYYKSTWINYVFRK
jgi:hypothetical protein